MESPRLSSAEPGHMDESFSLEGRSVSSEHSAGFLDPSGFSFPHESRMRLLPFKERDFKKVPWM